MLLYVIVLAVAILVHIRRAVETVKNILNPVLRALMSQL